MRSAVRFLIWMAIVLAVGAQAAGLGTLGFRACVEESGALIAVMAPGEHCCPSDAGDEADDACASGIACERCVDMPLVLPPATAIAPQPALDDTHADDVPLTVATWAPPATRITRIDPPPFHPNSGHALADSLRIAQTIVLRI